MYELTLENNAGKRVELTNRKEYVITDIQGLNPPTAKINTSETALYDGGRFNSSKVNMRSINIALTINYEAEKNRIALYDVIRVKEPINLYYKNGLRDVYIPGYVESFSVNYFENKQTAAISILCPEPFFRAAQDVINEVSMIIGAFHFPFAITEEDPIPFSYYGEITELNIVNIGDVTSGLQIEIRADGSVINPRIYNRDTREFFGIQAEFEPEDVIYIDTRKGSKKVRLYRNGAYTNIFNSIEKGSTWLQLSPGDNIMTYEGEEDTTEHMSVKFIHSPLYEGV